MSETAAITSTDALKTFASNVAESFGGSAPTSIQSTTAEYGALYSAVWPGESPSVETATNAPIVGAGAAVDAVVMSGSFNNASLAAPRVAPEQFAYLIAIIDPSSGRVLDVSLRDSAPELASVGPTTMLMTAAG